MTDIKITANVSGAQGWFKSFSKEVQKAIDDAVNATALEAITDVKKRIQRGPKTGVTYTRRKGGNVSGEHRASAPGEAPATDTGALVSSVYFENKGQATAVIGSRLDYAGYLEFGTQKIAPRPSWTPAAEAAQPKLNKRVRDAIEKAARK